HAAARAGLARQLARRRFQRLRSQIGSRRIDEIARKADAVSQDRDPVALDAVRQGQADLVAGPVGVAGETIGAETGGERRQFRPRQGGFEMPVAGGQVPAERAAKQRRLRAAAVSEAQHRSAEASVRRRQQGKLARLGPESGRGQPALFMFGQPPDLAISQYMNRTRLFDTLGNKFDRHDGSPLSAFRPVIAAMSRSEKSTGLQTSLDARRTLTAYHASRRTM